MYGPLFSAFAFVFTRASNPIVHTQSHKTHEKKRGTDKSDRILRNAQERLQGGAAFEPPIVALFIDDVKEC